VCEKDIQILKEKLLSMHEHDIRQSDDDKIRLILKDGRIAKVLKKKETLNSKSQKIWESGMLKMDSSGRRESKNKTKKLLTCNRFAKILEKRKTLNSKPQKLGKMELGNEF